MKKYFSFLMTSFLLSLILFVGNTTNALSLEPPPPSCMGDTTCNETYTYDSLVVISSDLCPGCSYTMYYWRRECFNPHRVDFQTSYGEVSNTCLGCDWKELWKEGVKGIVLKEANKIPATTFQMTFSNEACWKKINGIGPLGVAGYTVEPCNTECCKYEYQVFEGQYGKVVQLISFVPPTLTCPPEDSCFTLCDPFGYFPIEKRSINELYEDMGVYPNPAKSTLNIKIDNIEIGTYEIRVTNTSGQTIIYNTALNQSNKLDIKIPINTLVKGTYYFTVVSSQNILKSGKFIVE